MAARPAGDAYERALALLHEWQASPADSLPAYTAFADAAEASGGAANGLATASGQQHAALEQQASVTQVERALAAIEARNTQLGAFVEVFAARALEEAAACDADRAAGHVRGPLHGVPVSVKDLFAVAGSSTRAGSPVFERQDVRDAIAVERLRAAGAVIIGKTVLHEFAMGVIGPHSCNPHDPARIAGGSSTGAAIAVAAGMGPIALGSDTRGSIRVPAALCGVVGLKPTFGAVSLDGAVPLSWTVDHAGPLAASVELAAAAFAAFAPGAASAAAQAAELGGPLRIGLPRAAWNGAEPELAALVDAAARALADDTALEITEADRPNDADFDAGNLISLIVSRCEAAAFHRSLALDRTRYDAAIRAQLESAEATLAADYVDAQRLRAQLRTELLGVFERFDALLMPTLPIFAPARDDAARHSLEMTRNVALWSFVGFPALTLPCGRSQSGLPAGLQLVCAPHREALLLQLGRTAENALR